MCFPLNTPPPPRLKTWFLSRPLIFSQLLLHLGSPLHPIHVFFSKGFWDFNLLLHSLSSLSLILHAASSCFLRLLPGNRTIFRRELLPACRKEENLMTRDSVPCRMLPVTLIFCPTFLYNFNYVGGDIIDYRGKPVVSILIRQAILT